MKWQNIFSKSKDFAIKHLLQIRLRRYIDRMLELSVDNKNKRIHAVVELKGEESPITIDVQYELKISKTKDMIHIKAQNVSISREWMNSVAQAMVGKEFPVHGKGSTFMAQVLEGMGIL